MTLARCLMAACAALFVTVNAAAQQPPPTPGTDTVTTAIAGVVKAGVTVKAIKSGFTGTEGPIGMPDGSLIFTETQANRITRIDANDQTSTFLENTNGSNGLAWDAKGRLISVQTTPGKAQIGVIHPKGSETTITAAFEGKPYGRPNDLVVSKTGHVYFTEPGPNPTPGQAPAAPPLPPAVYHVTPDGKVSKVAEDIARPNGIVLSPDEKTLYVNNTAGTHLIAFDVAPDGSATNRRDFAKYSKVTTGATGAPNSGADGLAVDADGRIYCASAAGVEVFGPKGEALGVIPISLPPQNLAFAGKDKRTLYVVGRGSAWRVALDAQGYTGRAK
jgi:gluconolactonase